MNTADKTWLLFLYENGKVADEEFLELTEDEDEEEEEK